MILVDGSERVIREVTRMASLVGMWLSQWSHLGTIGVFFGTGLG